jgi:hypothetical protein
MDDPEVRNILFKIREHVDAIDKLLKALENDFPPPANVVALKPDEVELEGILGRPQLKEVKGRPLFTAGLGIKEGNLTTWLNLEAWGSVAKNADYLLRGDRVRVVGKFKENRYLDSSGVMQVKQQFVASLISPVIASSGTTPSRVSARDITG